MGNIEVFSFYVYFYDRIDKLGYLETGKALEAWEECSRTDYKKREQVLEQLREKLLSPMPAEKKVRVPKSYEVSGN